MYFSNLLNGLCAWKFICFLTVQSGMKCNLSLQALCLWNLLHYRTVSFSFKILLFSTESLGSWLFWSGDVGRVLNPTQHVIVYCVIFHTELKVCLLYSILFPFRYAVLLWLCVLTSYIFMSFLSKEMIPTQFRHILIKNPKAFILSQFKFNILQWLSPFSVSLDSKEETSPWYIYVKYILGVREEGIENNF